MCPGHFLHLIKYLQTLQVKPFIKKDTGMIHLLVQLDIYIIFIFNESKA